MVLLGVLQRRRPQVGALPTLRFIRSHSGIAGTWGHRLVPFPGNWLAHITYAFLQSTATICQLRAAVRAEKQRRGIGTFDELMGELKGPGWQSSEQLCLLPPLRFIIHPLPTYKQIVFITTIAITLQRLPLVGLLLPQRAWTLEWDPGEALPTVRLPPDTQIRDFGWLPSALTAAVVLDHKRG